MCNRIVISSCSYGGKQTKMMAPNSISRSLEKDKKLRRASPCRALAGRQMICIAWGSIVSPGWFPLPSSAGRNREGTKTTKMSLCRTVYSQTNQEGPGVGGESRMDIPGTLRHQLHRTRHKNSERASFPYLLLTWKLPPDRTPTTGA